MRFKVFVLLSLIFCTSILVGTMTVSAAPGGLDHTFSGDGKMTDGLAYGWDSGSAVAVQSDGKVVVAGYSQSRFGVTRYNPNGSLDLSFGNGGKVTTAVGSQYCGATSVAIQPDGKMVVAGWSYVASNNPAFAIVRYKTDGSLDSSFSGDGWVTTWFGTGDDRALSVALQADGKIVAAGYADNGVTGRTFALARYNADGSLDTTFDGDGKATTIILGGQYDLATSVAIESNGRIVVAGIASLPGDSSDFAVVRYNTDGSLDTAFDGDGKVTTQFGPDQDDYAWAIAIQADGKIVAAGSSSDGTGSNFDLALVRYNSNGSLDTNFDGDGKVKTPIGQSQDYGDEVLVQPDGKIVVVGASVSDIYAFEFAAVRYNSNGSLDPTFDGDGKVTTSVRARGDIANAAAIQADGKIVAAGSSTNIVDDDFAIARWNPDGSRDVTFDSDGTVTTDFGVLNGNVLYAVAVQPDGKIVAAGSSAISFVAARYLPDGSPDTTFGGTGKVLIPLYNHFALDIALQPDGKIAIAGVENDSNGGAIVRVYGDGSLDTTFDGDGIVTENLKGAHRLAIQPDGKILVLGNTSAGDAVIRYNSNGSVDDTFGTGGVVGSPIVPADIVVQANGKIVVVGTAYIGSNADFGVVRYNSNGSLDTTFDTDGTVTTPVGVDDYASSVTIQPDGKLVVTGTTEDEANSDFALVRYNPDGSLDTTFDTDGKVATSIAYNDRASSVALQADGKIIVVGDGYNGINGFDFAAMRYNPDGSLDTTFGGGDGITTVDFDRSNDDVSDVAIDSLGRAVVVGSSDQAFAIARFLLAPDNARFDFDRDGRSDISVFRASDRTWYLNRSTAGFTALQFGLSTDTITPADFDGDGKTDIAVFRDGVWYWLNSTTNSFNALKFGLASDIPVPADYTGDGRGELAVYRNGTWWMLDLANNQASSVQFGITTDRPVVADYDGDGRADLAVYRGGGEWHVSRSTQGYTIVSFGLATDRPVAADYDGDGRADQAVYRLGTWYLLQSSQGFSAFQWGLASDTPAPADYDGDGKTDPAVFRGGTWYLRQSTSGVSIQNFGLADDMPVPAAFVP